MLISELIKKMNNILENYGDLLVTCTCNEIGGVSDKINISCANVEIYNERQQNFTKNFCVRIEGEE